MRSSKLSHPWHEMDFESITSGQNASGVSFLKLFLTDYCSIFNETEVNVSCGKCLNNAYLRMKKKFSIMKNPECGYKLKPKFENIPLQFGSSIFVNNQNITKEYAEILLQRKNGLDLFEIIPTQKKNENKTRRNSRKKDNVQQEGGNL
jgi:hypothetical protein